MKPSDISRWQGSVDSWLAQGSVFQVVVNPLINAILVDTSQLTAGWYDMRVIATGTAAYPSLVIQHRNAANSASVHAFLIASGSPVAAYQNIINWKVEDNERVRLLFTTGLTGTFGGGVHWVKRS